MKKLLILALVLLGSAFIISNQPNDEKPKEFDETIQVTPLGFEDSGSPKSFEDDWGG